MTVLPLRYSAEAATRETKLCNQVSAADSAQVSPQLLAPSLLVSGVIQDTGRTRRARKSFQNAPDLAVKLPTGTSRARHSLLLIPVAKRGGLWPILYEGASDLSQAVGMASS